MKAAPEALAATGAFALLEADTAAAAAAAASGVRRPERAMQPLAGGRGLLTAATGDETPAIAAMRKGCVNGSGRESGR